MKLLRKVEDHGALVDSPVRQAIDTEKQTRTTWLMIPTSIYSFVENDSSIQKLPERKAARFYCRGDAEKAPAHAVTVSAKLKSEGQLLSDSVWLTPLMSRRRGSNNIIECWIELK